MNIYSDPVEMQILVEQLDYDGNDCLWYLDEYNIYEVLDCRVMDNVINKKWNGKFSINCSIFDYSTSVTLMRDKFNLFANDRVFSEMRIEMFKTDRSERTHRFKFQVWLHSMILRFEIDLIFTFMFTMFFQVYLNIYSSNWHSARDLITEQL